MAVSIVSSNYNVPIDGFKIDYMFQMTLNESVTFTVFLTNKGQHMYSRQITIGGDDYKKWGNDDDYVKNFVAKQLGFVLSTPVVVPTPEAPVVVPVVVPIVVPVVVSTPEAPVVVPVVV